MDGGGDKGGGGGGGGGVRQRRAALLRDEQRHVEGGDEKIFQSYCRTWGGHSANLCFMTNIHIIGFKIGLKKTLICVFMTDIFLSLCF